MYRPPAWRRWRNVKTTYTQNTLLDGYYLLFEVYLQDKTSVYILKPCREIGQSFEEGLRGGKRVKNWEIFWMNNKTIEFCCRTMRRIMQISVVNILLDLHNSAHPTQSHSIILLICFCPVFLIKGQRLLHVVIGLCRLTITIVLFFSLLGPQVDCCRDWKNVP